MNGAFGGMLSLLVRGGEAAAIEVVKACHLFLPATSLGGVESLIEHRATVEGPESPVPRNLLRLSIGLEHIEDLAADLEQALDRKSTRLNSSHVKISYAVFCLKKKTKK